jgi:hypothetical protein
MVNSMPVTGLRRAYPDESTVGSGRRLTVTRILFKGAGTKPEPWPAGMNAREGPLFLNVDKGSEHPAH